MDFFDRQDRARKQTRVLVYLFPLVVLAVVVLTYLIAATCILIFFKPVPHMARTFSAIFSVFALFGEAVMHPRHFFGWVWDTRLACCIVSGTLFSITLGALYKIRQLSSGGSTVATMLGGRLVEPSTSDPDEQRLRNVVEEMAIASGTPVPEIYLLQNERGINAFAAGHTRDDVAIGVTRGCLKLLTRDELQGVIAHEFSHILNGDTRLNMRLIGLAHGLFWPTAFGRILIHGTSESPDNDDSVFDEDVAGRYLPTAPIGFLFVIFGSISLPFVRLLKSAICRQREWLADASAVQFTRNPEAVAGALKKIGGLYKRGRLDAPEAEVASHLYFSNSAFDSWFTLTATHPPLDKRILAVYPLFDGKFPRVKPLAPNQYERDQAFENAVSNVIVAERKLSETSLVTEIGNMTAEGIRQASVLRLGLPLEVKQALREPAGAAAVVYSLLLSGDDPVRAKQMEILRTNLDAEHLEQTTALSPHIEVLGDRFKLPLAEFAVPALRQQSQEESVVFILTLQQLIECDGAIDLFEFALMKMVSRQLRAYFDGPELERARFGRVRDMLAECTVLLSALAHVGHEDETGARKAFREGVRFLDAPSDDLSFLPRSSWDLTTVDAALNRLTRCPPSVLRNILLACGKTVVADGQVTVREAELLRAIADSLDCSMPPFVEAVRSEEIAREA